MARVVLVVDDEESIRSSIIGVLTDEGYQAFSAFDATSTLDSIQKNEPDVILLDVWMTSPSGEKQQEGLDILSKIKERHPEAVVIIMSGHGNIETAVRATKLGAYDFIEKPLSLEKLLVTLKNAFQLRDLSRENENLRSRVEKARVMIAESEIMKQLKQAIRRAAPTNATVLITGENGTGKELVAQMIHALSNRFEKPFVEVNSAAFPEELIESELFGHEKGAFTGATQQKRGKFDLAHQGTLFLDEIGDMSLKTQAKILRIIQEQRFERVGGNQTIEVDVRIIAATNKNLEEEIKKGNFREDLFYRLNVVQFHVPALRDRKEDIEPLTLHFFKENISPGQMTKKLSKEALTLFQNYSWPGNVRELKNTIERIVIFTDENEINYDNVLQVVPALKKVSSQINAQSNVSISHVSNETTNPSLKLKDAKSEFEKEFIIRKLKENDWNVSKTAQALGIERSHLHKKINSFGIDEKLSDD